MNLIRVGWVVVASVVRASLGQEERLVDCAGLNLDGPSLRVTVPGISDSEGLDRILDPKIELDLTVQLEGQLENPFEEPISSELGLVLNVMVQHPGGTLEVEDIATVMLDGGPIAPGQSVGFKVGGRISPASSLVQHFSPTLALFFVSTPTRSQSGLQVRCRCFQPLAAPLP